MNQGNDLPRLPKDTPQEFDFANPLITQAAAQAPTPEDVPTALVRYAQSDWDEVDADDSQENGRLLREGLRLFLVYQPATGTHFWVITEADRSATTVLLASDY